MSHTPAARSGSQIIIDALGRAGVEVVFGYPGGQIIPLYDALYDAPLRHILTRHEQGAAHAADGYARATGRPGVVLATSGPGATNLVTGLATAHMDSVPLVAITGQVPTTAIGNDAFQEADIYGITIPITKYNYLVKEVERLPMALAEAFYLAASGRPGVVLVDVPKDVQTALMTTPEATGEVRLDGYDPDPALDEGQVAALVEALRHSRRPVAYIGGGVSAAGAEAELFRLVTDSGIPVASTLMAKGAFPDDHPLALGLAGMHGAKYANLAIHESDLILCLGARFDDRVAGNVRRFAPGARVAHVDIDGAEIEKRVQTHLPVVGHLKRVLARLLELVVPVRRPEWLDRVSELKARHPLVLPADEDGAIRPQSVIRAVDRAAGDGAVIVTDVGQHQMWAAQLITSRRPRHFLSSGGLGTMGYGLPAALGAQVGRPGARVVLITGDGGFQMNIQELATIRENNLPVKVVIVNNGCLGMVRQWQEFFYRRRYSQTVWSFMPDFAAIAGGYGLPGRRITEPGEVVPAIEELLESPGPGLLDCRVVMEENVLPMIPAGGGQDEFYEV